MGQKNIDIGCMNISCGNYFTCIRVGTWRCGTAGRWCVAPGPAGTGGSCSLSGQWEGFFISPNTNEMSSTNTHQEVEYRQTEQLKQQAHVSSVVEPAEHLATETKQIFVYLFTLLHILYLLRLTIFPADLSPVVFPIHWPLILQPLDIYPHS